MSKSKSSKHWHAINGSTGCLSDNNEIHHSKESAIESLCSLFEETIGLKTELRRYSIYYSQGRYDYQSHDTSTRALLGAEYCEIVECHDPDCLQDYE